MGELTPPSDVAGEEFIRVLRSIIEAHFAKQPQFALVRTAPKKHREALVAAMVMDLASFMQDFMAKHREGLAPGPSREAIDVSAQSAYEAGSHQAGFVSPSSS